MKHLFWLMILTSSSIAYETSNWPSFLGVGRKSVTTQADSLPTEWSATSNIAWQTPLPGYGQSSPVVWNGKVFLTCVDGPMKERFRVVCLELATGKILWMHEGTTKNFITNDDYHSRGAMSPVVDAAGVIAGFESGMVVAIDHTGKVRWSSDLFEIFGPIETNHGISSSLAQDESQVFVWVQRKENPYIIALNKANGAVAWKADRPVGVSWGSPVIVPMPDGSQHIVLSCTGTSAPSAGGESPIPTSNGIVCGLEPATGNEIWRVDGLSGNSSQTPAIVEPGRILVGASAGREGGPSKEAIASNGLIQIEVKDGRYNANFIWRSTRATSGFCSPCYHKGYAYFTDRRGQVACLDIETGAEVYSERLQESVWATPLGVGDKLFFVGEVGTTHVLRSGPGFEKLAINTIWEDDVRAQYSPPKRRGETSAGDAEVPNAQTEIPKTKPRQYAIVAVDDTLLIRRGDVLYALRSAGKQPLPQVQTTLSAASLFKQAHDGRYEWERFPGFAADINVATDGIFNSGKIVVDQDCNYKLEIADEAKHSWLTPKLQSIIVHRRPGEVATTEVSYVESEQTPHVSGVAIAKNDGSGVYRILDGRIREVHRKNDKSWFEISNVDYFIANDGRYLSSITSVTYRDPQTGNVDSVRANQFEWKHFGEFVLPIACVTIETGKYGRRNVQRLVLSKHRLNSLAESTTSALPPQSTKEK